VSMKISTRQVDGITVLDLGGRITLGEGSVQLRDSVRDLLAKGQKKFCSTWAKSTTSTAPGSASWSAPTPRSAIRVAS
jgi:hypothetical protein